MKKLITTVWGFFGIFIPLLLLICLAQPVQATMYYYMVGTQLICYESDVIYTEVWIHHGALYGLDVHRAIWDLGSIGSIKRIKSK